MSTSRCGFTLVELLVVIFIIVALMGLLIPIIGVARRNAQVAKTVSIITQTQGAIAKFQTFNSRLPEGTRIGGVSGNAADSYRDLMSGDPAAPALPLDPAELAQNNRNLVLDLATVDAEHFGSHGPDIVDGQIVDTWKNPLAYRPFSVYPLIAGAIAPAHSDDPPRPDSYQIWSFGQDLMNHDGITATDGIDGVRGDDVNNWSR